MLLRYLSELQKSNLKFLLYCQPKTTKRSKQMRVRACKGFEYHSVKLVLLANDNGYDFDSSTFFSVEALYPFKGLTWLNSDLFWYTFVSEVCGSNLIMICSNCASFLHSNRDFFVVAHALHDFNVRLRKGLARLLLSREWYSLVRSVYIVENCTTFRKNSFLCKQFFVEYSSLENTSLWYLK